MGRGGCERCQKAGEVCYWKEGKADCVWCTGQGLQCDKSPKSVKAMRAAMSKRSRSDERDEEYMQCYRRMSLCATPAHRSPGGGGATLYQ